MGQIFNNLIGIIEVFLKELTKITNNYGISIIIITIIVRLLMLPLTLKQEKSIKKMKEIQPEVDKLKEKYKGDPQTLNQKTMELYKENNVNPMGGCLPMLIQLPIFIALYRVFVGNTIPGDATFLWFNLKQPDMLINFTKIFNLGDIIIKFPLLRLKPLGIISKQLFIIKILALNLLPILNTVVTFVQQKMMTPTTKSDEPNPMQSMMYTMPLMMLFIFYNMPSGVTLYYLVSGVLSVVQQHFVMKGRSEK